MGIDYTKGFLEVPILDKTHYFTLKCSHIVFVDLQYWRRNQFLHNDPTQAHSGFVKESYY